MTTRPAPIVTIIVVSYRTRELTLACLRSIVAETTTPHEIIVVDNASEDGSADSIALEFPWVRLTRLNRNVGFAAANNLAAQSARGHYLLLLNPDTLVRKRAIDRMIDFAREKPSAKIWGGRTLYADGSLNPFSCARRLTLWNIFTRVTGLTGIFVNSELINRENYGGWDRSTVREVDIVVGCFFLIEKEFWNALKGFDSVFFMYGEEADLCLRARKMGARPTVTPQATIVHYGGASNNDKSETMMKLLVARSELIKRHWPASRARLGLFLQQFWPLTRVIALTIAAKVLKREPLRTRAAMWLRVWRGRRSWRDGYPV